MIPVHVPVMLRQVSEYLVPAREESLIIDGTLGEGGHSRRFLDDFSRARVVGIDADERVGERAARRLAAYGDRFEFRSGWSDEVLAGWEGRAPDIVLMDLGVSAYHYAKSGRGFSFSGDEPLDMRLRCSQGPDASEMVNTMREDELADLIYRFGGERFSRRIARGIVEGRRERPVTTSGRLARIVNCAVPGASRRGRLHPATRTFQALRIAVNGELDHLSRFLEIVPPMLAPSGRLGVISFHSLEDRMVKQVFRARDRRRGGGFSVMTPKPLVPDEDEVRANPASRSAKFRVLAKPPAGEAA